MTETMLVPLFTAVLTLVMGGAFYVLYQAFQRNWSVKADEFRTQRVPAVSLMRQLAKQHARAATVMDQLEERQDRLEYRLEILGDLLDVASRFTDIAPLPDEQHRMFMTNVVLAATQALLPTQTNTRARLLIYRGERIVPYASYVPEGAKPFRGRSFSAGEGAVGLAFESRKAVIVSDAKGDKLFAGEPTPAYNSVLCAPVPSNGNKPIGVLNIDSPIVNHFTEEDAKTLATVANIMYILLVMQFPLDYQNQKMVTSE